MRKSLYIGSLIISTTLGAGFISGKEIFVFFGIHNNYAYALMGFMLFSLFFYLFIKKLLITIHNERIENYNVFNKIIMGKFSFVSELISIIFIFIIFSTMISAGGKSIGTIISNSFLSQIIFIIPILIVFILEGESIVKLSVVLTPIMILGIILLGFYTFLFSTISVSSIGGENFITPFFIISNSLIYVSYNSITLISLMCNLSKYLENKKVCTYSSLISSGTLTLLGVFICLPLIKNYNLIFNVDFPFFYILKDDAILKNIYFLILLLAIFTTAISSGFSLIKTLEEKCRFNKFILKLVLITFGVVFSKVGFSYFVSFVYPIFGVLGFLQIYRVLRFRAK